MTDALLLALLRVQLGTGELPGDDRLASCDWPRLDRFMINVRWQRSLLPIGRGAFAERQFSI